MRTDKPVYRPFIVLLPAMIAGLLLAEKFPGHIAFAALLLLAVLTGLILLYAKQIPSLVLSLALFCIAGYMALQPWVSPRFPAHHVIHLTDDRPYKIMGIVDERPVRKSHRTRAVLAMKSIVKDGSTMPVCGRIRVTISGENIELAKGDDIIFYSRIQSIRNFSNPGGFDYRRYMAFQKVWGRAYAQADRISVRPTPARRQWIPGLDAYRRRISALIDQSISDVSPNSDNVKAILNALLLGDKTHISKTLRDAFNRTGISHLLAISGLHVGIVAFTAFAMMRWLVSFIRPLLWSGRVGKAAAALSFLPIFIYGFLAGMSPSTQRAVIMVSVFLLTYLFDRDQDLMNTMAVAAMAILVLHPPSLFSISFQLSFSAVLAIVVGMSHFKGLLSMHGKVTVRFFRKVLTMGLVTLFASIGTAPLVMYYFNQVSLIGLGFNLIMVPVIGFTVVPLGLFSIFIWLLSADAAGWGMRICGMILDKSLDMITFFSNLSFASVKTVTPSILEICLAYLLLWGIHTWVKFKFSAKKAREGSMVRRQRLAMAFTVVAAMGISTDAFYWIHQRYWCRDLRITVLDVGQASSALLELPKGHTLLIDGGGFSNNDVFDAGALIVAPYLWRKKIKTIDTMILSHANADHYNGLIYIAEHFNVKQAITNHEPSPAKSFEQFMAVLDKKQINHPAFPLLERNFDIHGVRLELLHPEKDFLERTRKEFWRNLNNNSIVLRVKYGERAFLFPGDIMKMAERALVSAHGEFLKSDVLLAPHHGSASSSSSLFLSQVDPEAVIVSAGWQNRFRFPNETVLQRYDAMNCRLYRTDLHGAICIRTDGHELKIRPTLPES
jgi:competence protein ComEC